MENDKISVEQPAVTNTTKELSTMETEQPTTTVEKTLPQLETEIKEHLTKIAINYIEVGNRLLQAKKLVEHGQWQKWLENNFQLKRQSAQNFMNIAERFGEKYQSIGNLNYTQMIAMLALPEGQEEDFIEQKITDGTPVENMSIRNLKTEIEKWNTTHKEPEKKKSSTNENTLDAEATISSNLSQDIEPQNIGIQNTESQPAELQNEEFSTNSINPAPITTPEKNTKSTENQNDTDDKSYFLLEQFLNLSNDLVNIPNLNELAQKYSKNNLDKLKNEINNLLSIINMISPTPSEK